MVLKFSPQQLDPRLDDEGKPVVDDKGVPAVGPFLSDLFQGCIELKAMTYPERLRFPKDLGIENLVGDEGEQKQNVSKMLNQIEVLAKASEKILPLITKVELKYKDGTELKTADDLYAFAEASSIVTGICTKFIMGFVGKKI